MSKKNTGGSAFPTSPKNYDAAICYPGLTIRDYFAAKVMQALITDPDCTLTKDEIASISYMQADTMLRAREE
jgi:hypothetical protein